MTIDQGWLAVQNTISDIKLNNIFIEKSSKKVLAIYGQLLYTHS